MGFFSNLSGVLSNFGIGGPSGVVLRHNSGKLLVEDNASTLTQAQGADPVAAQDFVTKTYGDTNYLGGGGITPAQHKALRDLIHFIDDGPADGFTSGSYKETVTSGALTLSEIWYDDNTKAKKIVELLVTYTGVFPTTEVWKMYDTDGVSVLVTLTDAITYSGPFEDTRTRTWV